jgi:hypothetical protein
MAVVGTVALGGAAVVIAGAGPALASGQYCTSTNDFTICQQVNGAGTAINWAKGIVTPKYAVGYPFEITMTDTSNIVVCTESFPNTNGTAQQSCYWNGHGEEYLKGNVCTAVDINTGVDGWVADGKSCLYVS